MDVMLTLGYRDIYNAPPASLEQLLEGVPSRLLIAALCKINAVIYLNRNSVETQFHCLRIFASRVDPNTHPELASKLGYLIEKYGNDMTIFHEWYTLHFIEYELLNFREGNDFDLTPEQELNILKAYFSIVDTVNDRHITILRSVDKKAGDSLFFQKTSWPILFDQHIFNNKQDVSYLVIRSIVFFAYLESDKKFKAYLDAFLKLKNRKSSWDYVGFFLDMSHSSLKYNEEGIRTIFRIGKPKDPDSLTENILLNIDNYQKDKRKQKDFLGLKEEPLFEFEESYAIIYWGFLVNKLYLGLIFDFYSNSGINIIFKTLPDFLNDVATNLSEKILFKGLMTKIFSSKYNVLQFDDNSFAGMPDCYLRIGKYIFLFEFKDALISAETIESCDFEIIAKDIDVKYVKNAQGKSKGISQLFEQIQYLNENKYLFDDYEAHGIKRRNLVIYPIIVYTNFIYSASGVTDYLNQKFQTMLKEYIQEKPLNLQTVNDLTMIDIEFLYRNFKVFQEKNNYFKELLDKYHDSIKARIKKMRKEPNSKNVLSAYEPFEQIVRPYHGKSENRKFNIISELFGELKIEIPEEVKKENNLE